jgi:Tol biopolymer transport system component
MTMAVLSACGHQASPTATPTPPPTEIAIEGGLSESCLTATATAEPVPMLAGVVFSHNESLWQLNRKGEPTKVLDGFPDSYGYVQVSWDSKRIIFEQDKQVWVVDLVTGERKRITDDSRSLCCFGWAQGQSDVAYYAFERAGSRDFEYYPITMTVVHFADSDLEVLEEKQFPGVSHSTSIAPGGHMLAYHNDDGAWIIQENQDVEFFSAEDYGLTVPPGTILTNPAWSPDGKYIAWTISGLFDEDYQTRVVVFDLANKTPNQIHEYRAIEGLQSIRWLRPRIEWSPNGRWLAFDARDAAFSDDAHVWVFSLDGAQRYHTGGQEIIGWSWNSKYLCHRLKDYSRCVDVTIWQEHRLTPLPFDSWGFIGWTTPVESE